MYKSKYKKIAKEVILSEINSLKKLKASIDKNFYKVIETIVKKNKGISLFKKNLLENK